MMCVGTQAVALVSHGRVADVVVDDGKGELGLCVKLASAVNSILERQILVTNKQEKRRKMLKMIETLSGMASDLQMLTSHCVHTNRQREEQLMNGMS